MPLVEYVGNATPDDNTEVINLHPAEDGTPRSIERGKRALLSGDELVAIAANYEVKVIADTEETEGDAIPTTMPEGYDDEGYQEDEREALAEFTPEKYPDPEDSSADEGSAAAIPAVTGAGPSSPPASPAPSSASSTPPAGTPPPATPASPGASG
jgi:hypothetical protein